MFQAGYKHITSNTFASGLQLASSERLQVKVNCTALTSISRETVGAIKQYKARGLGTLARLEGRRGSQYRNTRDAPVQTVR